MTIQTYLERFELGAGFKLRRKMKRLSEQQLKDIERGFQRHITACQKLSIEPDPEWLISEIEDTANGRYR